MEPFASAQNDLFVRLSSRKDLRAAGIDVQVMRPRAELEATAIIQTINHTLAGTASDGSRAGLAVLVPLPGYENKQPNIPGLFGDMVFSVIVLENIMINMGDKGTGVTCEEAATMVMLAGHNFPIMDGRGLTCDGMSPLAVENEDFTADVAYEIRFRCKAGFNAQVECSQPVITNDAGNVTVSCATANAVIWVTLDGSMPHPGNPTAFIAAAAFDLTAPAIIRACAYHDEINPSAPAWLKAA
jgi:hypothetical protein